MNAKTQAAVIAHGETVKAVFGLGAEVDPVKLCKQLRKLERQGAALGLRLCNGPEFDPGESETISEGILGKVDALLHFRESGIPVFVNLDPRGYALKIDDTWMRQHMSRLGGGTRQKPQDEACCRMRRDWGGYGIIAPDLTDTSK